MYDILFFILTIMLMTVTVKVMLTMTMAVINVVRMHLVILETETNWKNETNLTYEHD